eukprot:TRINITY_DN6063_c0_g1_i1.p1 TRINITY_DN6063_c0_g1~~TRINITY_DN6063_c0_g1_i1.p1  ORF type:complete len:657 (-),score=282.79 TRINITY_DN6063_c0_g1_i1:106-2019(-)
MATSVEAGAPAAANAAIPPRTQLNSLFQHAFRSLVGDSVPIPAELIQTSTVDKVDYQCSQTFAVFSQLQAAQLPAVETISVSEQPAGKPAEKGKKAPRLSKPVTLASGAVVQNVNDFAQLVVDALPANDLVGPLSLRNGAIQLQLSPKWLAQNMLDIVANDVRPPAVTPQTVLVDFSSPNIAKEMHVGHLRSTIIGDSICRILEFCGHKVLRVNHVGDWGTQFGMLIAYLKREFPDFLSNTPNISDLQSFYKASKKVFDAEPEFKDIARGEVVKLQSGDATNVAAWKMFLAISMREFEKIYQRLDVTLETRGESFYNPYIPNVIAELDQKGMIKIDGGAKCIFVDGIKQPLMVQKSDGGFGYDSTDLATLWYRTTQEKADWLIYVVDAGQSEHFTRLFKAGDQTGWYQPGQVRIDHVAFGVVQGDDGKKFKTRSGSSVKLGDLLDEGVARAEKTIRERVAKDQEAGKADEPFSEEEIKELASALGCGSIKYADLRYNRTSDYVFSFDKMLEINGNTAVYLLYNYVRIRSIMRKAGVTPEQVTSTSATDITVEDPAEINIARKLARFPETLEDMLKKLMINPLCDYLYDLCGLMSVFHKNCRVLGDPKQQSRLLILKAIMLVMQRSFQLLGIRTVNKM